MILRKTFVKSISKSFPLNKSFNFRKIMKINEISHIEINYMNI